MRRTGVALILVAAAGSTACTRYHYDCEPSPVGMQKVWIPPRIERRLAYEGVCATTRPAQVDDLAVCRDRRTIPWERPVTERVTVPDTTTALAPVTAPTTVPVLGYKQVEDRVDRLCPRVETRCVPVERCRTTVTLGIAVGLCSPPHFFEDCRHEKVTQMEPRSVEVGKTLESLPMGSHLEQTPVGQTCVPIPVGADHVPCVTGSHVEERVTGYETVPLTYDRGSRVRVVSERVVPKVVVPGGLRAVEQEVVVPGFWAFVMDDPPAVRPPNVLSRAEYEEYLQDARLGVPPR